jgi:hypothetical protein
MVVNLFSGSGREQPSKRQHVAVKTNHVLIILSLSNYVLYGFCITPIGRDLVGLSRTNEAAASLVAAACCNYSSVYHASYMVSA